MKTHTLSYSLILFFLLAFAARAEVRERIYLQTDKQVYLSGEHLWMKLYLTDAGGKPTDFSKVGYVELADGSQPHIQVKIEIANGVGEGWMELPSRLPTGYYRLIAYTRYMENEGEPVYFHKTIGIVNTYRVDRTIPTDTSAAPPRISALPPSEGGVSVTPSASTYLTRTQGELRIDGLPAGIHSLAVSVAGNEFIPVPETTTIRRWHEGLSSLSGIERGETPLLLPEYEGHILQGRLLNAQTGEPVRTEASALIGFVGDDIRVFGGQADKQSNITFFTDRIGGKQRLGVVVYSMAHDTACRLELQSPFVVHPPMRMPAFSLHPAWEKPLEQRSIGVQTLYSFAYDSISRTSPSEPYFRWKPDVTYLLDEYTRFAQMQEMFIEFIPYLTFRMENGVRRLSVILEDFSPGAHSLALLDGVPIKDHTFLYNYDPRRLRRVDIYRTPFYFGGQRFEGIASFASILNDHPGLTSTSATRLLGYEGTQSFRHFYAPSYPLSGNETERSRVPDYRHTLLWEPAVQTNGRSSVTIPFATSDLTGTFLITIEGLTKAGRPVRATASFTVEERRGW
ncbi:MAG: hypothetical protein LBB84_11990 [Tannerellaceae bacterium]|jgi:hypothetical protein|nr:hypothetical protein [Tannerellaceae bacterium]